jgi:hypothetical protein
MDWYNSPFLYVILVILYILPIYNLIFIIQRIPKEVVRSLNISESGEACFFVDDYGYHPQGAYYTTTDGRMKFDSCWSEFTKEYNFESGNVVLILFNQGGRGGIEVSVDII